MNKKLDKKLVKNYPLLYQDRNKSPQLTLMCFGFMCGDGWYDLINNLSYLIESNNKQQKKKNKPYMVAMEVKEKFGGLRFYTSWANVRYNKKGKSILSKEDIENDNMIYNEINGYIRFAEAMSCCICEDCGNKGKLRNNLGWILTLCDKCYEEHVKKLKMRIQKGVSKCRHTKN